MKKFALSALVIAASGAYVWSQAGTPDPLGQDPSGADLQTGSIQPQSLAATGDAMTVTPREVPFVTGEAVPADQPPAAAAVPSAAPPAPAPAVSEAPLPADSAPAQPPAATVPLPRLRPPYAQAAAPLVRIAAATSGLRDGTYAGPVIDAYYGLMQIEAVIQNGRLVGIHVLQYPNDRRTSVFINRQALPLLRDEVIQAQSANVDIISGATLSSEAFIQSLGAALDRART